MSAGRAVIHVSALVVRDEDGRVLTVRKRGTQMFMFPGGKPEPGETPAVTAAREAAEEVGIVAAPERLIDHGTVTCAAANEDADLVADVFSLPWAAHPPLVRARGEIEELRWLDLSAPWPLDLAPLLCEHVLPMLAAGQDVRTRASRRLPPRPR